MCDRVKKVIFVVCREMIMWPTGECVTLISSRSCESIHNLAGMCSLYSLDLVLLTTTEHQSMYIKDG